MEPPSHCEMPRFGRKTTKLCGQTMSVAAIARPTSVCPLNKHLKTLCVLWIRPTQKYRIAAMCRRPGKETHRSQIRPKSSYIATKLLGEFLAHLLYALELCVLRRAWFILFNSCCGAVVFNMGHQSTTDSHIQHSAP